MGEQPIADPMNEIPLAGIHGLATHKTCGMLCRHNIRWALTPPFHHHHGREGRGCHSLSRYSAVTDSSQLKSMVLCVARTFLLPLRIRYPLGKRHDRPATTANVRIISENGVNRVNYFHSRHNLSYNMSNQSSFLPL